MMNIIFSITGTNAHCTGFLAWCWWHVTNKFLTQSKKNSQTPANALLLASAISTVLMTKAKSVKLK